MLKVSPVSRNPWFPVTTPEFQGFAPSERSVEIAKRKEELLGLLHDLPEQEFELSLTDLVEKKAGPVDDGDAMSTISAVDLHNVPADEGGMKGKQEGMMTKKRKKEMNGSKSRRRFRSRSDGVLLRFYVPASLTRSRTTPAPCRGTSLSQSMANKGDDFDIEREIEAETSLGCWSVLWNRRAKSRRQML
ncbi:hypothetical protein Cni_G18745 [Canna indica]|uniref:Uncharacterized protein n=1 Tax=Canna indica TaxID=4628 RepID=A0AAQ3QHV7_9LILI|nr:hypothetical protein Cni_G18745 [Canna indica]